MEPGVRDKASCGSGMLLLAPPHEPWAPRHTLNHSHDNQVADRAHAWSLLPGDRSGCSVCVSQGGPNERCVVILKHRGVERLAKMRWSESRRAQLLALVSLHLLPTLPTSLLPPRRTLAANGLGPARPQSPFTQHLPGCGACRGHDPRKCGQVVIPDNFL